MPDFTYETHYHCQSREHWETTVPSSKEGVEPYRVAWGRVFRPFEEYGWTCTCKAFQFGGGKECRHIKEVRDSGVWCGWMQMFDGGDVTRGAKGEALCPKCGAPARAMNYAV